ncbi:MAG TPA: hypothetical protein VFC19_04350 [Candidatus Limnocylindrales bacterium]|nr:hypothetical protein [Candidatus Limnocylindrales bacterium]
MRDEFTPVAGRLGAVPDRAVGLATGAVLDYQEPQNRSDWTEIVFIARVST